MRGAAESLGVKSGAVIHPLRVALTGKTVGPGVFELVNVLGLDRTLARLDRAIGLLERHEPFPKPQVDSAHTAQAGLSTTRAAGTAPRRDQP